ncbi:MAG: SDR family NAD(P)-dependent oxidoreductase [Promethearchaeota archaeon]
MGQNQKYALVTGGSSGIGMELSKLLGKDGYSLIIVAKPQEELDRAKEWFSENMPDVEIKYRQQDLAVQGAAKTLHDFTTENGYEIEIFINNAGFATYGGFQDIEIDRELAMINLNVVTVYHLTRLYLKDMVARNSGKILITSSTVAFVPSPNFTTYAATKSFSFSFGMAMNQELKDLGSNVSITVLCPPSTRTGFQDSAKMNQLKLFDKENKFARDADFVAEKAYEALKNGEEFVIPGKNSRILLNLFNQMSRKRAVLRLMNLAKWGLK